ncbi:TIGR02646 family protein [Chitinophaga sp. YR573]|uniref:retron system putative HNH endonuclease n=1 Tax=Chitinophaga sp. YR573 TaxID=1881040 RepID=UPI0008B19B76|nr:retron system putative HNH endonuclease [Chitinophaga sp. YR573]SEW45997.1 TIGR02646 family protein [Chitinophaga sp. YR573]
MKQVIKIAEPTSLLQHRAKKHSNFDNIPLETKEELRQSLLSEQGHICCYCMKRIPEKVEKEGRVSYDMKVEHFLCQDTHSELQLTYSNLHGACTGNEGKPKKLQTCDTKKANFELTVNPTSSRPNYEALFKYNPEGEISSINDNSEIDRQLNDILNLNMQTLKDGRSEIYIEVQEKVRAESKRFKNDKAGFIRQLEQERNKWLNRVDNKYRPYCMVAVYYLGKKIRQNQP